MGENIIQILQIALLAAIVTAVPALTLLLTDYIKSKKVVEQTTLLDKYRNMIIDVVNIAISNVNQVFVESLKSEQKFDKAAAEKALNMAITSAKNMLGADTVTIITNFGIDVDKLLEDTIEGLIQMAKNNGSLPIIVEQPEGETYTDTQEELNQCELHN